MTSCPSTTKNEIAFLVWYILLGILSLTINCFILCVFIKQSSTYGLSLSQRLGSHRKNSDSLNLFNKSRKLSMIAITCFIITTILETIAKIDCLMLIFNNYDISGLISFFKWIFLILAYIFLFLVQIYRIHSTFSNSIYAIKKQTLNISTVIMIIVIILTFIIYSWTRQRHLSSKGNRSTSTQSNNFMIKYNIAYFILISIICCVSVIISIVFATKLNQLMLSLRGSFMYMVTPKVLPKQADSNATIKSNSIANTNTNAATIATAPTTEMTAIATQNVGNVESPTNSSADLNLSSSNLNKENVQANNGDDIDIDDRLPVDVNLTATPKSKLARISLNMNMHLDSKIKEKIENASNFKRARGHHVSQISGSATPSPRCKSRDHDCNSPNGIKTMKLKFGTSVATTTTTTNEDPDFARSNSTAGFNINVQLF